MTAAPMVVDITQWYGPTTGGIRTYLQAKAAWAARRGVAHAVIAPGPGDGEARLAESRLMLVRGRTPTERWGYRVSLRSRGVLRALDDLRPDVVVVHDALAFPMTVAEWAHRRGASLVVMCHSHLEAAVNGLPGPLAAPMRGALAAVQRRAFGAGEVVMVASRALGARVAADTDVPVRVSPLGVDVGLFRSAMPDPLLRERLAGSAPLLLYAGRLSTEKRIDLLVPMLARVDRGAVLVVAGDGAARPRLERAAVRAGVRDRMVLLGHVADRERLARLMATADCFVHPNPDEPYGLAPVEAAVAGCRVVAARTVGSADVLDRCGAVLVTPGDAGALAAGVQRALLRPRATPDTAELTWDHTFDGEWRLYERMRA